MASQMCYFCQNLVKAEANNCPHCGQPQILQGKYRLTGLLGQGGFGIVYDATDLRFNRRYAIKAIITSSATAQTQVLEEANILAGHARHFPFMPEIYDTWSERDRTFLVMEYVPGPTLADLLDDHGRWTAAQVEQFMRVTLADLAQLHAAGIIHRDLKPANIKRTAKGTFVLLDFGISKQGGGTLAGARALSPPLFTARTNARSPHRRTLRPVQPRRHRLPFADPSTTRPQHQPRQSATRAEARQN